MKIQHLLALCAVLALTYLFAQKSSAVAQPAATTRSWQVTCATTATAIVPDGITVNGYMCSQSGTTATFVGGADVNTTTLGQDICTTNCPIKSISVEAQQGYCIVASSTETLTCTGAAL
jgi:hypothetical protein